MSPRHALRPHRRRCRARRRGAGRTLSAGLGVAGAEARRPRMCNASEAGLAKRSAKPKAEHLRAKGQVAVQPKTHPKGKPPKNAHTSRREAANRKIILYISAAAVAVICACGAAILWKSAPNDSPMIEAAQMTRTIKRSSSPRPSTQAVPLQLEMEAKRRKQDPNIATEVGAAYVAFGGVRKGTIWYIEALRRQVALAGADKEQLAAVSGYGPLHLSVHLELHAIQLARQLLRTPASDRAAYVKHLEDECGGASDVSAMLLTALEQPFGLPRRLLAGMLAQCAHAQHAMSHLSKPATSVRLSIGPYGVMHFLAHFGDTRLIADALSALPAEQMTAQLSEEGTLARRTPAQIAESRGYVAAAHALRHAAEGVPLLSSADAAASEATEARAWRLTAAARLPLNARQRRQLEESAADDGGWGGGAAALPADKGGLDDEICEIDVVHVEGLTPRSFALNYFAAERPLLIRNGSKEHFFELRQLLSREGLTSAFGNTPVKVSANPYHDGVAAETTTLGQFASKLAAGRTGATYLFESLQPRSPLRAAVEKHMPSVLGRLLDDGWRDQYSVQLAIGGAGSGAPTHYHKAAVNSLFYGKKRWWLWRPKDAQYSSMPIAEWFERGGSERASADERRPLNCVQRTGDVLYVPDFWGHAVLNLEPAVAVATEVLTPRVHFYFQG